MKQVAVESIEQAKELCNGGFPTNALIFKHSPRCSISNMAWDRFTRDESILNADFPVYLVNVLNNRESSQFFAEHFGVEHASPQLLLVKNGVCVFNTSHSDIDVREIPAML